MWYIDEFDRRFTGFLDHLADLATYIQRKEFFFNKHIRMIGEQFRGEQSKKEEENV